MPSLDLASLQRLVEPLTRFLYALLGVALLSVFLGFPDSGLFFLLVAAMAHVLGASIREVAQQNGIRRGS
jgi:hypothetical protein